MSERREEGAGDGKSCRSYIIISGYPGFGVNDEWVAGGWRSDSVLLAVRLPPHSEALIGHRELALRKPTVCRGTLHSGKDPFASRTVDTQTAKNTMFQSDV
ncbi:hypothetical protein SKAU_G00405700 [Synaphobranchus kaupii]|uniref:Uncharacterized protein n=1 Tax=Synaphobranchus kaupii TaxID=118154 RepID=A0A9Q1EA01_SYNKA|nr:hypothetical protein SKAU_G00405700 [Synaphobranchus kaupii]